MTDLVARNSRQYQKEIPLRNVNIIVSHSNGSTPEISAHSTESINYVVDNTDQEVEGEREEDEDEGQYPDGGWKAWSIVLGSFFGLVATFGLMNSIGSIQAYITDHQFENLSDPNVASGWVFAVFISATYYGGIFSGILFDEFGAKIPLVIGAVLFSLGLLGTANSTTVAQFVISFGFVAGLGTAISITPLLGAVSQWFKYKRGLATGICTLGGSVGGMVFPLMLKSLYESVGFEWAIRILTFVCLACFLISFFMIESRISSKSSLAIDRQEEQQQKISVRFIEASKVVRSYFKNTIDFKSFKDPKFLLFSIGLSLSELSLICTLTYVASYALATGVSSTNAYLLITVQNATGILGRLIPNRLSDIYGPFNVVVVMVGMVCVATLVVWRGFGQHQAALWVFCLMNGFFSTSTSSMASVCCGSIIPMKEFGRKYATCNLLVGIVVLVMVPIGGVIIGDGSIASYNNYIVFSGALAVASEICWISSRYSIVGWRLNVRV